MEFKYRCPVCRANNTLTANNLHCRRCAIDLSSIYASRKRRIFCVLKHCIAQEAANPTFERVEEPRGERKKPEALTEIDAEITTNPVTAEKTMYYYQRF